MIPRRLLLIALAIVSAVSASAQTPLAADSAALRAEAIYGAYEPWQSVEMTGKLAAEKLPVKVSVKLFMLRGSRLMISLSAPLVGEAARIEITRDSITAVNRMKRIYVKESLAAVQQLVPVTLSDVQDIFLGRVFKAGVGTLSGDTVEEFEWLDNEGDTMILAAEEAAGVAYGFIAGPDGLLYAASVVSDFAESRFDVDYQWNGEEKTIDFSLLPGSSPRSVRLQLGKPRWNASPFASFSPNDRYRQVGLADFVKSF